MNFFKSPSFKAIFISRPLCYLSVYFFILPQNTSNTKKQGDHTKANKSGEEAQKETMGLIDIGLPQSKK